MPRVAFESTIPVFESVRKGEDGSCLRQRGHCERPTVSTLVHSHYIGLLHVRESKDAFAISKSASLFWCQAPNWNLRPDFFFCLIVARFLTWGASLTRVRVFYNVHYNSLRSGRKHIAPPLQGTTR
jgi:hypothetical protein